MRNRIVSQTQNQDGEILSLYLGTKGPRHKPSKIVALLNLTSVSVVYGAIRRWKYRPGWFHVEPKTNQNKQATK